MLFDCSAECSFSCLERLKSYFRATMSENRLDDLVLLCIESCLMQSLDVDNIVEEFSNLKGRRKYLLDFVHFCTDEALTYLWFVPHMYS